MKIQLESKEADCRIGKVILDLRHYAGRDLYSDGSIEDILLDAVQQGKQEQLLRTSTDYAVLYHLSDIRYNLLEWFPFKKKDRVLEIGSGCGGITGLLSEKCGSVTCVELSKKRSLINAYRNKDKDNISILVGNFMDIEDELKQYDIVTLIGVLEYSESYIANEKNPFGAMLRIAKKHLSPGGHLLIAIENKMGLKYLNGAPEDHTGVQYSGVNDYINGEKVHTFSKPEIEMLLKENDFTEYDFYYPLPDYKLPTVIYSDRYAPFPSDIRLFGKEYSMARVSNFNEAAVYDQLCADGQFPYFANSFLISVGEQVEVTFASYQRERLEDKRIATVICDSREGRRVKKYGLTHAVGGHIDEINKNRLVFEQSGLPIKSADGYVTENVYCERFIEGKTIEEEFFDYRHDKDAFINEFNQIKTDYLTPLEKELVPFAFTDEFKRIFGDKVPDNSKSLEITNVDLILSNLKRNGDSIVAFDLEWCFNFPIPYDYPIWRAANYLYEKYNLYLKNQISKEEFLKIIGIEKDKIAIFQNMEMCFAYYVTGYEHCEIYTDRYKKQIISPQYRMY